MSVLPTDRFILRSLLFVFQEDASGSCQVTYTMSNHSITKTKDLLSCSKPKSGFTSLNKASPLLSLWGAQLMLGRAIPKISLQVGLDSHSQLPSASCTSLGWDSDPSSKWEAPTSLRRILWCGGGWNSKGALGHPIPTLVITSDLAADPAWEGADAGVFPGSQTHWIGD